MLSQFISHVYDNFWLDLFWIFAVIVSQVATVCLALISYLQSRQNTEKLSEVQRTLDDKAIIPEKVLIPLDRLDH